LDTKFDLLGKHHDIPCANDCTNDKCNCICHKSKKVTRGFVIGNKEGTEFLDSEFCQIRDIRFAYLYEDQKDAETEINYICKSNPISNWQTIYPVTIVYTVGE
jgi:hypothetical protein